MNVVVVDDERIILQTETLMIKNLLPNADVRSFSNADETLNYAKENVIDIAFLDVSLEAGNGIELAKKLQVLNDRINIIFCTGYSEYSLDALDIYCSAYLTKPITEDKLALSLKKLRYPINEKVADLYVKCFGNFEVFYKDSPIKFKYAKTKEMFAYLIDRKGSAIGIKEIMTVLLEDDDKDSYIRNLKADLIHTFELLRIEQVLDYTRGKIAVKTDKIDCDYYEYLAGNKELFKGEYMSQYSFGDITLNNLIQE